MNSLRMSFECIAGRTSELESKLQLAFGRRSYGKLKLGLQRAGELRGDVPCFLLLLMSVAACRRPFGLPPRRARERPLIYKEARS